jgi:UDP-2,3-diacylglucosamine pyrophosphatase LpxH
MPVCYLLSVSILRTVVVSDVHLGYEHSDVKAFDDFINNLLLSKPDCLILLGDIFDFWRRSEAGLLFGDPTPSIVEKLLQFNLVYVRGNHDFSILKLSTRYPQNLVFQVQTSVLLSNQSLRFVMIHGYELEVFVSLENIGSIDAYEAFAEAMCHAGQTAGTIASDLYAAYSWIKSKLDSTSATLIAMVEGLPHIRVDYKIDDLAKSTSRAIPLGLKPGDVFVFGHTHRPFIEKASQTVNTGSWVMDTTNKQQHTYLEITDRSYDLKTWPVSDDFSAKYKILTSIPIPSRRPKTDFAIKVAKSRLLGA